MRAYADARLLYQRGQYRDAVKRLEEARVLDPTAKELIYNLALVHEKLAELEPALRYMRMYVAMESDPVEKERAEKAAERLEGAKSDLDRKALAEAAPPSATQEPPPLQPPATVLTPSRRGRLDYLTLGAAGVSVAALGVGTFFGVSALSTSPSEPTTTRGGASVRSLREEAKGAHEKAIVADIGFGIALAAGAAAAILYFTRTEDTALHTGASRRPSWSSFRPSPQGLEVAF